MFILQNNSNRFSLMGHKLVNMHRIREFGMFGPKWNVYSIPLPRGSELCAEGEQKDWRSRMWQIVQGKRVFQAQLGRCTYAYIVTLSAHIRPAEAQDTQNPLRKNGKWAGPKGLLTFYRCWLREIHFLQQSKETATLQGSSWAQEQSANTRLSSLSSFFKREKLGGCRRGKALGRIK